ncbi:Park2p [Mactra antiquata]
MPISAVNVKIGKNDCRLIDISSASSVSDVKAIISSEIGLEPCFFDLLFCGKVLKCEATLEDLNLGESSILHVFNVPDGGKQTQTDPKSSHLTVQEKKTSDTARYQYYVYCNVCNGLEPGKLRVRCSCCLEGAVILDREPCGWDDVLIPNTLYGHCTICDKNTSAQFYFKCCQHDSNDEFIALRHIRPNRRHVDCVTCATESSPILVYPCADKHVMCIECFISYSQVSLDQRSFIEDTDVGYSLPCPAGCEDSLIKDNHHFKLLGKDQYERYKHFGAEECVIKSGGYLCPNTGCGEGIMVEDDATNIQCTTCMFEFCRECKQEIHSGSCRTESTTGHVDTGQVVDAERALRARWDAESLQTIQEISKLCPNCAVKTERNGGCMHMKCSRCHYEWCWLCQKEWDRTCMSEHWFG